MMLRITFLSAVSDYPNYEELYSMSQPCESTRESFYIDVEGKAFPCSFCPNTESFDVGLDIANCNNFIEDIWENPRTVTWRNNLLDIRKTVHVPGMNLGLKDALNKALSEKTITEVPPGITPKKEAIARAPEPTPISLASLRPTPAPNAPSSDRAANADAMNKLKSFIFEKVEEPETEKKPEPVSTPVQEVEEEIPKQPEKVVKDVPVTPPADKKEPEAESVKPKEVPEEVLRKILE
jgi:hypothetical protein